MHTNVSDGRLTRVVWIFFLAHQIPPKRLIYCCYYYYYSVAVSFFRLFFFFFSLSHTNWWSERGTHTREMLFIYLLIRCVRGVCICASLCAYYYWYLSPSSGLGIYAPRLFIIIIVINSGELDFAVSFCLLFLVCKIPVCYIFIQIYS